MAKQPAFAQRQITLIAFAKLCHCSHATVKADAKDELEPAMVGHNLNQVHPAAQAYLERKLAEYAERKPEFVLPPPAPGGAHANPFAPPPGPLPAPTGPPLLPLLGLPPLPAPVSPPPLAPHPALLPEPAKRQPNPESEFRAPPFVIPRPEGAHVPGEPGVLPKDIEAYRFMTLDEIVSQHGSMPQFFDYLQSVKKMHEISRIANKNEEESGRSISRQLVNNGVFGYLSVLNDRLLGDCPKSIATLVWTLARSTHPTTIEEATRAVREEIESQLEPAKQSILETLRNA